MFNLILISFQDQLIKAEINIEQEQLSLKDLIEQKDEDKLYNYIFNQRKITKNDYKYFLEKTTDAQRALPPVINITIHETPLIVIGDLHGSRQHFDKYYAQYKDTNDNILFMGDFVDRGSYSLEIFVFCVTMQMIKPDKYFFLRGNHEDIRVNKRYGFTDDIMRLGDSSLIELTQQLYDNMPLNFFIHFAGKIYFATHGGLFMDLDQNQTLYDLLMENNKSSKTKIGHELLWNDPHPLQKETVPSRRGSGLYQYGSDHFEAFSKKFGITGVIRAHQVQPRLRRDFGDWRHLTVFGSSQSGFVLQILPDGRMQEIVMK